MIKNKARLDRFYRKLIEQEDISFEKALSIYELLHKEAIVSYIPEDFAQKMKKVIPDA